MVADLSLLAAPLFGPGVMRAIQGKSWAEPLPRPTIFRDSSARDKKVLKPDADAEGFHLLLEGVHITPCPAYTPPGSNFPVTRMT
jgi:hypothetical protein